MKKPVNITHMTSVHTRYDTRIFVKECCSLADVDGYRVNLIVADGQGDETRDNVQFHDVGLYKGRLKRMIYATRSVLQKALELDSDIYHFHDPELIPAGLRLARLGKRVIFDVHENVAEQILGKSYLPNLLRTLLSRLYTAYERRFVPRFTLILAEDSYANHFGKITDKYTIVLNMPQTHFFNSYMVDNRKNIEFFYIGGVSEARGVYLLLDALMILHQNGIPFKMHFVGPTYDDAITMEKYRRIEQDVIFHGKLDLTAGYEISRGCMIGLSILKPIGNYITSYSTKIFEYMAVKLPVITSNFPLYEDVIEKYNCGLCVNPLDPQEIATAIQYVIEHPEEAREMGENGKNAVDRQFNWGLEQGKLYSVYESLT